MGILRFEFYSGKIELGKNHIDFKSCTVRFGFGLSMFGSLRVMSLWIGFELGASHFGCGSFHFVLEFRIRSIMDQVTSGVRVQINSSHFGCQFGYGSGLFGSGFSSRVSFA